MAYNTLIVQGSFVSAGANQYIPLRGGVSWMEVWNITAMAAAGAGQGVYFYWQSGMNTNSVEYTKTAVTGALVPEFFGPVCLHW